MNFETEITLLIKSRYSLVLVDTIDEDFVSGQLLGIAAELNLNYYCWSLTKGLRAGKNENSFYQSNEPVKMLKIVNDLVKDNRPSLFVFSDFNKFLEEAVTARLFKDITATINNTRTTVVLIGADRKLPDDIEPYAARITGGYPDERRIMDEINHIVADFRQSCVHIEVELRPEDLNKMVKTLKGLSVRQIRNVLNNCILKDCRFDGNDLAGIERYKKEIFDQEGILKYFAPERKDRSPIATKHILEQIKLTRPLSAIKSEDIDYLRGWAKERSLLPV